MTKRCIASIIIGVEVIILKTYISIFEENKEDLGDTKSFVIEKIFSKMDELGIELSTLNQEKCAEIISLAYDGKPLSERTIMHIIRAIKWLYEQTGVSIPDDIKDPDVKYLSAAVVGKEFSSKLYKDLSTLINAIDGLGWRDYCADVKAFCVLAWYGFQAKEMPKIKVSDINSSAFTVKKGDEIVSFDPDDFKLIEHYRDLEKFVTPCWEICKRLVTSDYLFRPCETNANRAKKLGGIRIQTLTTKVSRVSLAIEEEGYPKINAKNLSINGDFYRAYVSDLSKFIFTTVRRGQYEVYLKTFWSKD